MRSKKKKKLSLSTSSSYDKENGEIQENEINSDDEYLAFKYPEDGKINDFLNKFSICTQDKKEAGSSKENNEIEGIKLKCNNCPQKFNKSTYSILCISCEKWFCLNCASLTRKEALNLKKEKINWRCNVCLNFIQNSEKSNKIPSELDQLRKENNFLKKMIFEINKKMDYLTEKLEKLEEMDTHSKINKFEKHIHEILELLQEKKNSNQIQNTNNLYSNILKNSTHQTYPKENIPVLIIKPKKNQNSKQTREEVQQKVNPISVNASIRTVQEIKNGGILIKATTRDEIEKIRKLSEEKLHQNYLVHIPKLRHPRLVLIGLKKAYKEEELLDELRALRYINENDNFTIKYIRQSKFSKKFIIYIETKMETFKKLVNQEISLGWNKIKIKEDLNIITCFKCCEYGHKAKDCNRKQICSFCGNNHNLWKCQAEYPKCNNCITYNTKYNKNSNCQHEALSSDCPLHQQKIKIAKEKINYSPCE